MSKCSLQQKDWGAALARAGRAERIAAHDRTDPARTAALRRTAVVVSSRAALGMQRFGAATGHASRLLALPPPKAEAAAAAALKEGRLLVADIQRRVAEVKRSNKRLAKELSAWVNAAMSASEHSISDGPALTPPPSPPTSHGPGMTSPWQSAPSTDPQSGETARRAQPKAPSQHSPATAASPWMGGMGLLGLLMAAYVAVVLYYAAPAASMYE